MSEYLAFRQRGKSESGKTEVWDVVARRTQTSLGRIRCFNTDCLDEISNHVADLNRRHRGGDG